MRDEKVRMTFALFNFFFVICGIICSVIGALVFISFQDFILPTKFLSIPIFALICGFSALIIGFCGCCGVFQRSYCMIATSVSILIIFCIIYVTSGLAVYFLRNEISNLLQPEMTTLMESYVAGNSSQYFWDYVQFEYHCCGVNNYTDWTSFVEGGINLPLSCCDTTGAIGEAICQITNKETLKEHGCLSRLNAIINGYAEVIAGVAIAIAIIQLIGIGFSFYMARNEKKYRNFSLY